MGDVEVVGGSSAIFTEDSESVAVVEEEVVLVGLVGLVGLVVEELDELLCGGEVAIGCEDGVGEDRGGFVEGVEDLGRVVCVEVVVGVDGHLREFGGVVEGCMGAGVEEGVLDALCFECLERGEVGGVSVGEEECCGGVGELCECGFEVGVWSGVSGGLAGGGGGEAEGLEGGLGGGDDFGVVREGEVIASAEGQIGRTCSCITTYGSVGAGDMGGGGGFGGCVWHIFWNYRQVGGDWRGFGVRLVGFEVCGVVRIGCGH